VLQQALFLAGPESRQHQNGLADSTFSQLGAFRRTGYAEPIGPRNGQRAGDRYGAVAIRIGLYDGKNLALAWGPLRPRFRGDWQGVYVPANRAHVMLELAQPYFGPHRAAIKLNSALHSSNYQSNPKRSRGQNGSCRALRPNEYPALRIFRKRGLQPPRGGRHQHTRSPYGGCSGSERMGIPHITGDLRL